MGDTIVEIPFANDSETAGQMKLHGFIAGPENVLASTVTDLILGESPATEMFPIMLYGGSGSGKTFLAHGLYRSWTTAHPNGSAVYCSGHDFAQQFYAAIKADSVSDFRTRLRGLDLLIIDDIHKISTNENLQEELLNTLDQLHDRQARVMVTSSVGLSDLPDWSRRLSARLCEGLNVPLAMPALDCRVYVIGKLAELRGLELNSSSIQTLAQGLVTSVPQLQGAMNRLLFDGRDRSTPGAGKNVTLQPGAVRQLLDTLNDVSRPEPGRIVKMVARAFSVRKSDMVGKSRRQPIVTARAAAMYLLRNMTDLSLDRIGKLLGGRDHRTVSHGCRATETRIRDDESIRMTIHGIQRELTG